ncbi:hypothetical protein EYB53_019270 [Candidatus Chloroploca sp. M-50]|uniref:Uncharacterized protein n=1 Tax=Candidatus Chloroploca mongolica TaxID=2528176 RepID=A0ABS4DEL5_9CHLR|nr:hypothetical protein [Candidatus Chloroploca mongolica]MBP1467865.1 hypothetical protein [Candidatus Chloroploca mongolica]
MFFLVTEVHNFGGFFGGDTVSLSGKAWRDPEAAEQTLTIDEAALVNLMDRHLVAAGMLLELTFAGARVEAAVVRGASEHATLRRALGEPELPASFSGLTLLSCRCAACKLWVTPVRRAETEVCPLCGRGVALR